MPALRISAVVVANPANHLHAKGPALADARMYTKRGETGIAEDDCHPTTSLNTESVAVLLAWSYFAFVYHLYCFI